MYVGTRSKPKYMIVINIPRKFLTVYSRDAASQRGRRPRFDQFYLGKILHEGHYTDMGGPKSGPLVIRTPASSIGIDRTVLTPRVHFELEGRRYELS